MVLLVLVLMVVGIIVMSFILLFAKMVTLAIRMSPYVIAVLAICWLYKHIIG